MNLPLQTNIGKVKKTKLKIDLLDEIIPEGIPINSLILLSGEPGISKSLILQNITFQFLKSKYVCIYVCTDEHPIAVYQNMKIINSNITKYLKNSKFIFIDCFSYRLNLQSSFNNLPNIIVFSYPKNWNEILVNFMNIIDNLKIKFKKFLLIIDSFTELINKLDYSSAIDLVKTIRTEICKKRQVLTFISFHFGIKLFEEFEQVIEYLIDGIFDLRYDPYFMQKGILVKQLRVRKIKGSSHDTQWHYFTIKKGKIVKLSESYVLSNLPEFKYQNYKNIVER